MNNKPLTDYAVSLAPYPIIVFYLCIFITIITVIIPFFLKSITIFVFQHTIIINIFLYFKIKIEETKTIFRFNSRVNYSFEKHSRKKQPLPPSVLGNGLLARSPKNSQLTLPLLRMTGIMVSGGAYVRLRPRLPRL